MNTSTGTFQGFQPAFHSFGEQVTTIDGQRYLTWFDLRDEALNGPQETWQTTGKT
ncbi:MAG: hypothetical protein ACLQVX_10790 [Limisphaerales bacterium]